ncbi:MAG: alanine racemase [Ulvibacter sp.]|jgi:alanine racemase
MMHTSQIFLNKSALKHNLEFIKQIIGKDTRLSSVVKGNAYGHGIEEFVPLVKECGVNHFSVFSADEALRVRKTLNDETPIMIMGMLDNDQMEWMIENGISFFVFERDRLERAVHIAKKINKRAKVHIEVETGMNRTGFSTKDFPKILQYLKNEHKHLTIKGLCTHYAGAESIANHHRVKKQQRNYNSAYERTVNSGIIPELKHTACSAATMRYPKTRMDLVRIGILQYGFFPSKEILIHYLTKNKVYDYPLKRVITWKSKVMSIKLIKTGEFIGYGTSYLANTAMKIATVPVGYGHGFSRELSNQGRVLIHGKRVSIVGTINMNMMCIDVTNLEDIKKGDEIVIIGKQGDLEITVASFSDFTNQLNYELLVRLPSNIPRKVID